MAVNCLTHLDKGLEKRFLAAAARVIDDSLWSFRLVSLESGYADGWVMGSRERLYLLAFDNVPTHCFRLDLHSDRYCLRSGWFKLDASLDSHSHRYDVCIHLFSLKQKCSLPFSLDRISPLQISAIFSYPSITI